MTQTPSTEQPAKTYGPGQAKTAKLAAENIWLWGIEMVQAVQRNDLERVAELAKAVAEATEVLAAVTARAAK